MNNFVKQRSRRISSSTRKPLIITIDGPVGAGKSSVAKLLAQKLGYRYIDSGAMYRAVACEALCQGINLGDEEALSSLIDEAQIEFREEAGKTKTYICGRDVSDEIRSPQVSQTSSKISTLGEVRRRLVALQRQMGKRSRTGLVMEGRDMGTVVFPDANVKFFLDGSLEERARRRYNDLLHNCIEISLEETMREIQIRDERDSQRELSPLKRSEDCISIDSTQLGVEEVVDLMLDKIRGRLRENGK